MLVIYLKYLSTVNICDSRKAFNVSDIIWSQCIQVPDVEVAVGWMVMHERDFGYVWGWTVVRPIQVHSPCAFLTLGRTIALCLRNNSLALLTFWFATMFAMQT